MGKNVKLSLFSRIVRDCLVGVGFLFLCGRLFGGVGSWGVYFYFCFSYYSTDAIQWTEFFDWSYGIWECWFCIGREIVIIYLVSFLDWEYISIILLTVIFRSFRGCGVYLKEVRDILIII